MGCRFPSANLLEYNLENFLKFGASVRPFRKCAWIENRSIVIKGKTKSFPVEIVKSVNEILYCRLDILLLRWRVLNAK